MTLTQRNSLDLFLRGEKMEYTVNKLAKLSGVSARTLRYYDEIDLLKPKRVSSNGYRIYGEDQVNMLQQILFYRELGISLDEIKEIISASSFNREKALETHLTALTEKKQQLETMIENVIKTMAAMKGETIMSDKEKFKGFKKKVIEENENKYGKEIRGKYGDEAVDGSNARVAGMTEEQWKKQEDLSKQINETLKEAMKTGDPEGELAQEVCDMHREWICMFWKEGMYSKEAHKGLGEMYVCDERFKAYYDKIGEGAAEFLRDALNLYCIK